MQTIDLDLFSGLYTEANPSDLPPGASPQVINCDFIVGTVKQRPGKQSQYYFTDFFSQKNPGFAQSAAGAFAPDETPWDNPPNIELDTLGSYASVTLNPGSGGGEGYLDDVATNSGSSTPLTVSLTPGQPNELAILVESVSNTGSLNPGAGWNTSFDNNQQALYYSQRPTAAAINITQSYTAGAFNFATLLAAFGIASGGTPSIIHQNNFAGTLNSGGSHNISFSNPITAGNTLFFAFMSRSAASSTLPAVVSDTQGNTWVKVSDVQTGTPGNIAVASLWACYSAIGGAGNIVTVTNGSASSTVGILIEMSSLGPVIVEPISQVLEALNFGFTIPATTEVLGLQVELKGHQSSLLSDCILTVQLSNASGVLGDPKTIQLGTSDASVFVGEPTDDWGISGGLTPALFNDPNFQVNVVASALDGTNVGFNIYAVKPKVWLAPDPAPSFNYIKTFSQTSGQVNTLALTDDGVIYQEDVNNAEGALTGVYTAIEPNFFAQSVTQSDREFIAISNLLNGTDIPYSYNGTNFDRLSQVGPGAPPSCSTSSSGSDIVSITQNPAFTLLTGAHDWLLVSDSPSDHGTFGTPSTPGNVMALIFRSAEAVPSYIKPGSNVVLSGFPLINGNVVNNDPTGVTAPAFYTVTAIGQPIPGEESYDAIVFTVRFTTFYSQKTPAGCNVQATVATMTTSQQVPNLEVGSQFQASGTGGAPPAGYDATWLVTATPNAAQLLITSTVLTSNLATYGFTVITGSAPTIGQAVTVVQTLNGNGVFNVTNAVIAAVSGGTFSINIVNPDVSSSPESGSGIIFGTIFEFDAFAIIGDKLGGTVVTAGVIAPGRRKCCYSYLTRDGYVTQPSPIFEFDVPSGGASVIAVANLLTGPSNVIARIIHFTAAEGGNFYNIPQPVTVNDNGSDVVNSSTWVLDNTTTNVVLSFSDGVLLAALGIDVQGNNLFETAELGSSLGFIAYANRIFAIGEQNKLTNFLNWSFDGGIQVTQSTAGAGGGTGVNATYPAGWALDLTNGGGVSVIASPIFGFAYSVANSTGSPQATYGMITQGAYQDEFEVPIIQASTTYSVRVAVSVPAGTPGGNLVVDLFSPSVNRSYGTYTLDLSGVGTTMEIHDGTLLTAVLAPVPIDLQLRLYTTNHPNGMQVLVDRVEVFPTQEPNLDTQLTGSYENNYEAFDQVSGIIGCATINQQPARSAFVLYDQLFPVKTNSFLAIRNVDGLEPVYWGTPRTISTVVGTPSIYGVTSGIDTPNAGEQWAIIVGQAGCFIFNGGDPIKLSEEIQSLWNLINWKYGHTLWVINDVTNRRILIGVPLKTPNPWLPTGIIDDDDNPTTPNVVLELSYKQLNTAGQLASSVGIHPTYTGKLIATENTRKWSLWTIQAPCAAFVTRSDTTAPLFLGNSRGTGKIYKLVDDLGQDDGSAIDQRYITYGFPDAEQAQGLGLGPARKMYEFMTMILDGNGSVQMTTYPNSLDSVYTTDLLPNLTLPSSINGDIEIPVNESAYRLFLRFRTNAVDANFQLSKIALSLRQDPWSPVRGRNN